jgi:hypothetical protein
VPNDRSSHAAYNMVDDYIENVLRTMLEKAAVAGAERTPNEQKIGDFYAGCMTTDAIEKNGLKPLQAELARIAALSSKDGLPELLAHYQLINDKHFRLLRTKGLHGRPQANRRCRSGQPGTARPGFLLSHRRCRREDSPRIFVTSPMSSSSWASRRLMPPRPRKRSCRCKRLWPRFRWIGRRGATPTTSTTSCPHRSLRHWHPRSLGIVFLKATGAPWVLELNVANPDFFPILKRSNFHRSRTFLVIMCHMVDPTAHGITPHEPGIERLQQFGYRNHILHSGSSHKS